MHEDPVLSKHVDTMVSSGTSGVYADSSLYIFFILNEMLAKYNVSGNEFEFMNTNCPHTSTTASISLISMPWLVIIILYSYYCCG
jgi:hypothetical protein